MALKRTTVTIGYTDGRVVTYPITPKIQMLFERTYGIGIAKLNDGNSGATNVYNLAWFVQSHNLIGYPTTFSASVEDWLDTVDAVTVDDEDVVPFGGAALNGGSVNSQSRQESASVT